MEWDAEGLHHVLRPKLRNLKPLLQGLAQISKSEPWGVDDLAMLANTLACPWRTMQDPCNKHPPAMGLKRGPVPAPHRPRGVNSCRS
jgi:hypothetical protein